MMFLIDSSGWIEFFADSPLAKKYSTYIKEQNQIITPTLVVYEVYKKIKLERTEEPALIAIGVLGKTKIIPLTFELALTAADISLTYKIPMADAIIYATAIENKAKLITSDSHLKNLPNVTFIEK